MNRKQKKELRQRQSAQQLMGIDRLTDHGVKTPRGAMTRYKPIINGVFALETDQGKRMIAVCYPLRSAALSGYTMSVAEQTEYDLAHGIDTTLGYLL